MIRGRVITIGLGLCAVFAFAGCYASTEPATDIGLESATLHARGTANNGPASSAFRYWLTGSTGQVRGTPPIHWPAGASGPFSQKVTNLAAGADYSFSICGSDDGASSNVCAQTRTFTTKPAVEDSVSGSVFGGCCRRAQVDDARSTATGGNPRGSVFARIDSITNFTGDVTCLAVDGRSAVIGAVGFETIPGMPQRPATLLVYIIDGHLNNWDRYGDQVTLGSSPPDCATTNLPQQFESDTDHSTFVVNDAL